MLIKKHNDSFYDEEYADHLQNEGEGLDRLEQDHDACHHRDDADDKGPEPVIESVIFQDERALHLHDRIHDQDDACQHRNDGNERLRRKDHEKAGQGAWQSGIQRDGRDILPSDKVNIKFENSISEQDHAKDPCCHDQDPFIEKT